MPTSLRPAAMLALLALGATCSVAQQKSRQDYERAIDAELVKMDEGIKRGPYTADWKALEAHNEAPDWFRDAKFGIYWHWGVYTVPAYGNEWYAKWMHTKTGRRSYYQHHVETYGEPDKFGYHDFIPQFKAEKFNPDEWADLLKQAGARYAGPVCEHHDGFSMWDSELTPWCAGKVGPKRDTVGELEKAIRARGMKFVTTFHHERTRNWYPRVEGWPTTTSDPLLQLLYMYIPEELFDRIFQAKLGEVIDKYRPDLIWFDGALEQIPEPYHQRFLAYYFNNAKQWGRDVVVTTKGHDYPPEIAVEDFEKGRMNRLTDFCWLTDDTISLGSWCYTQNLKIKPTSRVLHDFVDIVSKNGCLLLNISPKSEGTIPDEQRQVLLEMGQWLTVNGEAIYETRPWLAFGEGPTRLSKSGGFVGGVEYSWQDVRYTRSKDGKSIYAILLGWPAEPKLTLHAPLVNASANAQVTLLGHEGPVTFATDADRHLVLEVPQLAENQRPCQFAYTFKLTGFDLALDPNLPLAPPPPPAAKATSKQPKLSKDLVLEANEAGLSGAPLRVEQKIPGKDNVGNWGDARGRVAWKFQLNAAGKYTLSAVIATRAVSKLALEVGDQKLTADIPATGDWDKQQTVELGTVTLTQTGVVELKLSPADQGTWKAVNIWQVELKPAK